MIRAVQPAQSPPEQPQSPPDYHPPEGDRTDVLGRRIAAGLVDFGFLVILFVVFGVLFGDTSTEGGSASVNLTGGPFVLYTLITLLYYGLTEGQNGQTLGKRLLGVRVVRDDGSRAGAGAITVRTVLRIVDGLIFYLVALVVILATGERRQRIGDLAAGTRVVRA